MSASALYTFGMGWLVPALSDRKAHEVNVGLAPGTYARGTLLGQISSANVADVQTITVGGSPTHSTITIYGLPDGSSMTFAQDVTPAAMVTAINARLGAASVGITGTANASYVITWGGSYANQPMALLGVAATFSGGTSPTVTIAHTTTGVGPNGTYAAYASGNSDGSQIPAGILKFPCTVDSTGKIVISSEVPGFSELVASMYYSGSFRTEELVGLDANAVTKLAGHIAVGTTTTGLFTF